MQPRLFLLGVLLLLCAVFPTTVESGPRVVLPPSFYSAPPSEAPSASPDSVVHFVKTVYKALGDSNGNATSTADRFQNEFNQLNSHVGGNLRQTLSALLELRLLDLQTSVRHARRMRRVVRMFREEP